MRQISSFWWQCAKIGAKGTFAFANDWQWLVGFPLFAGIVVYGLGFRDPAAMTATGNIIFDGVIAAFLVFLLTAFARLGYGTLAAAPEMYYAEKRRADILQAQFVPHFRLMFEPRAGFILDETADGLGVRFIRILPICEGDAAISCEPYLSGVHYRSSEKSTWSLNLLEESLPLIWSYQNVSRWHITKGVRQFVDICKSGSGFTQIGALVPCVDPLPNRLTRAFSKQGYYRFDIIMIAGSSSVSISIQVHNNKMWNRVTAQELPVDTR